MISIHFYSFVLLGLLSINYAITAPIFDGNTNYNGDESMQIQHTMNNQSNMEHCQHSMTYDEIRELLAHNPCAFDMNDANSDLKHRTKRDDNHASTSNVYALQSTINDHRTIMNDHRTMINYLMNNTVNSTQFNQYYAEQHATTAPIWKSWRDVSLLILIFICFCAIIYVVVSHIHPLDILTSILLRRHENKQRQQDETKSDKPTSRHNNNKDSQAFMMSTIEREHTRYHRDSISSQ